MDRWQTTINHDNLFSVIIDDLYIEGVAVLEAKADPPLVIDADAPLPDSVMPQHLQSVRWW